VTDSVARRTAERDDVFRIRQLRDRRAIDALFSDDRAYGAYALGYLEGGLFERAEFWVAESQGAMGMVLHGDALGPSVVTAGDTQAIDAILSLHPGPRSSYLSTATPAQLTSIERWYHVEEPLTMQRMWVTRAGFHPTPGPTRRLHGGDVREINALYALDDRPSHYTPVQIDRSIYYGVFEDGTLVSIAGTHLVAPTAGIGMIGNVLTHPAHRGRNMAKQVTSAVTAELVERGCAIAALTAAPDNTPAVRAYSALGFQAGATVVEAHLRRRDPLGLGAWLRRKRARADDHGGTFARGRIASERDVR